MNTLIKYSIIVAISIAITCCLTMVQAKSHLTSDTENELRRIRSEREKAKQIMKASIRKYKTLDALYKKQRKVLRLLVKADKLQKS